MTHDKELIKALFKLGMHPKEADRSRVSRYLRISTDEVSTRIEALNKSLYKPTETRDHYD